MRKFMIDLSYGLAGAISFTAGQIIAVYIFGGGASHKSISGYAGVFMAYLAGHMVSSTLARHRK